MMTNTIFLVGYMCSGKTTLGRELARLMGLPFRDLDQMIEQRCQMSATEIFAQLGEQHFRQAERWALLQVLGRPAVVACGGGTPCYGDNMQLMNQWGFTVWLRTSAECIAARLALPEHKSKRPTIAPLADAEILPHVQASLARRERYYALARLQFCTTLIETARQTAARARELRDAIAQALTSA